MNKARSFEDKFNFCWKNNIILKPEWIQGFVDGEGSFQCEIYKNNKKKIKSDLLNSPVNVNFSLQIQQSNHDVAILNAIKDYFSSGYLKPKYNIKNLESVLHSPRNITALWIRDFDLISKFFDKYPLHTMKKLDYSDWKRLIDIKIKNKHINKEELELMLSIKNSMNSNRYK